jgi:hypothetical protein
VRKSSKVIRIARVDRENIVSIHIYDLLQRELRKIPPRSRYNDICIEICSENYVYRDLERERSIEEQILAEERRDTVPSVDMMF